MGIRLVLHASVPGRFEDTGALLAEIGMLALGWCQDTLEELDTWEDERGRAHLALRLHPAAEWLLFADEGEGRVRAEADGAYVGPGHQVYAGSLLRRLAGALGLSWRSADGEENGDPLAWTRPGPAREAALAWLREQARARLAAGGAGWKRPLMRDDAHRFELGEQLATPLGPRDRAWLETVAEAPEAGMSVLPWLEEEGSGAERLGRALYLMWTEVRYRPLLSEMEESLVDGICDDLETAHGLDPELPFPYDAWRELYGLLDGARAMPRYVIDAAHSDDPPVGYRRGEVTVALDGFTIRVPGTLAEEERESGHWLGDLGRELWFQGFALDPSEAGSVDAESLLEGLPDEQGEPVPTEKGPGGLVRRAVLAMGTEDGNLLHGAVATPEAIAVLTVRFADPDDLPWALGVWRSVG